MENISIVIKAVFGKFDGSEVLSNLGYLCDEKHASLDSFKHMDTDFTESQLVNKLLEVGKEHSIDQLIMLYQLAISKWVEPDKDCLPLQFSTTPSVFNILLYFASHTLTTIDGEPVCKYEQLLRWHLLTTQFGEDLFTTAYLASRDVKMRKEKRRMFGWKPYLGHNCREINAIFDREMVDLHMHLNGSSLNCEIGWLCLMNNFDRMQKQMEERYLTQKYLGNDAVLSQIITCAAAIRLYLAGAVECIPKYITSAQLHRLLYKEKKGEKQEENTEEILAFEKDWKINLQEIIDKCRAVQVERQISTCSSVVLSENDILDYIPIEHYNNELVTNLVVSSERRLMYNVFRYIYDGKQKNADVATLFFAYLLYKKQYRDYVLQLNDRVGFANFSNYESRKTDFILDRYKPLLYKVAIQGFLENYKNTDRYVEVRITPEETVEKIANKVGKICSSVDPKYWNKINLILHFIKQRDEKGESAPFRHYDLREKIKREAYAIYRFRRDKEYWRIDNNLVGNVVGIDAANSEIFCRPEVFAQAFRFLRKHDLYEGVEYALPADLRRTFHVGEDYLDIADGLRAVEEAIIFLGLGNGDRIGHALVLGVDVKAYYEKRYHTICARKQVLLDNFAWLYHKCTRLIGYTPLCGYLESMFHKYFNEIYRSPSSKGKNIISRLLDDDVEGEEIVSVSIHDYYQSWLLRGNSPKFGVEFEKLDENRTHGCIDKEWVQAGLNHHAASIAACRNENARELFDKYHSPKFIKSGDEVDSFSVRPAYRKDFYALLEAIQEHLLDKIERKHIAIECNPSSNYKIGDIERYDQHPILRFFNYGLNTPYPSRNITVSINTDDQGIFATSLEREYSLMALAIERNQLEAFQNSSRAIAEWLERIRKMSVEQKFMHT